MLNKSRVWSLWLVSFLVGLKTYQQPLVQAKLHYLQPKEFQLIPVSVRHTIAAEM
jgi:hypothetical protein